MYISAMYWYVCRYTDTHVSRCAYKYYTCGIYLGQRGLTILRGSRMHYPGSWTLWIAVLGKRTFELECRVAGATVRKGPAIVPLWH